MLLRKKPAVTPGHFGPSKIVYQDCT